jgi:hypothetical protein
MGTKAMMIRLARALLKMLAEALAIELSSSSSEEGENTRRRMRPPVPNYY